MRSIAMAAAVLAVFLGGSVLAREGEARLSHRVALDVRYPVVGDSAVDGEIREWLEEHIEDVLEAHRGLVVTPDVSASGLEAGVDYTETRPSARVRCFAFTSFTYSKGAAHPSTRVDILNFDMESKRPLELEDLFDDVPAALRIMSEHAKAKVNEGLASSDRFSGGLADDDTSWFNEGFAPEKRNYSAFAPEPGGLRVVFQQYQVLPYVFGLPEALFPLDLLAPAAPRLELWAQ